VIAERLPARHGMASRIPDGAAGMEGYPDNVAAPVRIAVE